MSESYHKINDYTLEAVQILNDKSLGMGSFRSPSEYRLTRIFNFGTGQITTLARHFAGVAGQYSSDHGAGVTSSVQMHVQDFRDLPSLHEVKQMHRKLKVDLKGNPPPLEEILDEQSTTAGKPKLQPRRP